MAESFQLLAGQGSTLKQILESIPTASVSPDHILAHLDKYDIKWYVTDEGDLFVKYWQIAAEDFVPREQVARIRTSRPTPAGAESLEWLSKHLEEVRSSHAGEWVGIYGGRMVAASPNLTELLEELRRLGIDGALVTQIPAAPIVWRAVYGG